MTFDPKVGDKVHICFHSDVLPATVVKRTPKRCVVQSDNVDKDPTWEPEIRPGGFSGVCDNQERQRWLISENSSGVIHKFFLHKSGNWLMSLSMSNERASVRLGPGWAYKYDFNF